MNNIARYFSLLLPGLLFAFIAVGTAYAEDTQATRLLIKRNAEFDKEIIQVSESVYTAVGYAVSPVSMIVGSEGIVIVDAGLEVASSQQVRADFQAIVDKPVKAIIFTHGHPDHIHGASAFMDTPDVQIWAREGFGHEQNTLEQAGIKIQKIRGKNQAGFALSPKQRINNGVAKAFWPKRKSGVFGAEHKIAPTHLFDVDRFNLTIEGLDLELVAATGETEDALYISFPAERVVFAGDNFYKSWPNLYALRGTPYRDIRSWANVIDQILQENPLAVVGGHTRPVIGEAEVNETLSNYRDAIRFLFDKTVEGINRGMAPNQLVDYVVLPEKYQTLDYLRPYYGNPEWAVRAIFSGYLGWFDGNATNLFPLSDRDEAERVAKMAGGQDKLGDLIAVAIVQKDYQWAAQLSDYLITLDPKNKSALLHKAYALTALAKNNLTTTARNYYLSSAILLRKKAKELSSAQQ